METEASNAANLISAKSFAPQVGESFGSLGATISEGKICLSGRSVVNGRFDFVITASGELKVGSGHFSLSGEANSIKAAGQIRLYKGQIMEINNNSGHYQPDAVETGNFINLFKELGLDVSKAKLKIFTE